MKAPKIDDLSQFASDDKFYNVARSIQEESKKVIPKTYSISQADIKWIATIAARLAEDAGQPVSASTALRLIISEHKAKKEGK